MAYFSRPNPNTAKKAKKRPQSEYANWKKHTTGRVGELKIRGPLPEGLKRGRR